MPSISSDTWFVLGTGPSLVPFLRSVGPWPDPWPNVVGVNDVVRFATPHHLVVLDRPSDFLEQGKQDVLARILEARPAEFWHCQSAWDDLAMRPGILDAVAAIPLGHAQRHRIRLLRCDDPPRPPPLDTAAPDELCFAYCSPYAACHVALRQGAKRIGLVGVDFVDHPSLKGDAVPKIDEAFGMLHEALEDRDVELRNLSEVSVLRSVPRASAEVWAR